TGRGRAILWNPVAQERPNRKEEDMKERKRKAPAPVGRATDNVRYWVAEALSYEFLPRVQNLVETIETRAAERNRPPVEIARSLAEESRRAAGRRETAERVMERVFPPGGRRGDS